MGRTAWVAAFGLAALMAAGCGGSKHEKVMKELVSLLAEYSEALASVKDKASAQAAEPKLQDIGKRMRDIQDRMQALGEPSDAEMKRLQTKYESAMDEQTTKVGNEMMRIMTNPELREALGEGMGGMFGGPARTHPAAPMTDRPAP